MRWTLLLLLVFACGCKKNSADANGYKEGVWYEQVFYISAVDFDLKSVDIISLDDKHISLNGVSFNNPIVPTKLINTDFEKQAELSRYLITSARFKINSNKLPIDFVIVREWAWTVLPNGLPS